MATNRPDTLDPALMRPGRLDRKVEFGLPDLEGRSHIFKIHARSMSVERDIRFELLARLCPNSTGNIFYLFFYYSSKHIFRKCFLLKQVLKFDLCVPKLECLPSVPEGRWPQRKTFWKPSTKSLNPTPSSALRLAT